MTISHGRPPDLRRGWAEVLRLHPGSNGYSPDFAITLGVCHERMTLLWLMEVFPCRWFSPDERDSAHPPT